MLNHNTVETGEIFCPHRKIRATEIEWNAHPAFKGVYLKHLLKAADTDAKFSCHLVKVAAGCQIGLHTHEGQWELHEVIEGQGQCILDQDVIPYQAGVTTVIPAGIEHVVIANQELYLLAKFIPALL